MNTKLILNEESDAEVYLEVGQLSPLTGIVDGPVFIRTGAANPHKLGPTVLLTRKQIIELRNWLNEFLIISS